LIRLILLVSLASMVVMPLTGCTMGIDARKRASLKHEDTQPVGGVSLTQFARTHSAALLTGADEVEHLHVSKNDVQGVFRRKGAICRTVGGCAAVPVDARGYWLTAAHCAATGAVLIHTPSPDGIERGVPARIVWRGTSPGMDIALLYAPLPEGVLAVDVSHDVRVGAEVVCIGSGIASDKFSAGHVVGIGGSTDGSVVWLEHDAPLAPGDSGGPAFYADGLLAGINFEAGRSFTGETSRATAIQPNMQQLLVRINEDWESMSLQR
jgi:S1-C subfamily serine protease